MSKANPDQQRHVFSTFYGMPPDTDTPPVCGATLTRDYDGRNRPDCPACLAILAEWRLQEAARAARLDAFQRRQRATLAADDWRIADTTTAYIRDTNERENDR